MRLRNLKDKDILIENCSYLELNPEKNIHNWSKIFNNNHPIHLEIGMGKGDFIYNMALKYPQINFIGLEKYTGVLARAIKKYPQKLPNLRIINMDALNLNSVFNKEIDTVYLNFSDPWPKNRHEPRRLTSQRFLDRYQKIFKNKEIIIQKTDNRGLFEFSLMSFVNNGFVIEEISLDLQNDDYDNVETEYEEKFKAKGFPIYMVKVCKVMKN